MTVHCLQRASEVYNTCLNHFLIINGFVEAQINREEKTIQGVDDSDNISLLQTETCTITLAAKQLLELVHDTLQVHRSQDTHMYLPIYYFVRFK